MKHPSAYLDWYSRVPHVKYDLRSSGVMHFKYDLNLGEVDLSANYDRGNPETAKQLAMRYDVKAENVFVSSEGASGQCARIIRCLSEKLNRKREAIVEYPTYEPLLRQAQEYFPRVKRLHRREKDDYRLDADELRKIASKNTALLIITNSHAPSGAISDAEELTEIVEVAREFGFYVFCDETYGEFNRNLVPTIFSVDSELGIVATGFTKAYGLGGVKLGVALACNRLIEEFYADVLNTVGNSPNIVQLLATELVTKGSERLERHKQRWTALKEQTEEWLDARGFEYFPNKSGVTYWIKLPIKDTFEWINKHAIPDCSLALVPGTFFLFEEDCRLTTSNRIRLGLGSVDPNQPNLTEALRVFEEAVEGRN